MKKIAFVAFLCVLVCYVSEARPRKRPTPTPTPSPRPTAEYVCRTKQQDAELRDWIIGIQTQATQAIKDAEQAKASNLETGQLLARAKQDADEYARQCKAAFECYKAPLSCWFHRFVRHILWIGGAIILILVALCVASIFVPALAPILGLLKKLWGMIFKKNTQ